MSLVRTTAKLALAVLALVTVVAVTTRFWGVGIGRSLVCAEAAATSQAMLVENFDPTYVLFERAAALEKAGLARTVFVPVEAAGDARMANPVSTGVVEVMARHARLRAWHAITITQTEPIALNAALQIRSRLVAEKITSVIVIAPGFRSRRSALVYQATLAPAGIRVHCVPVFGRATPETWTDTWHGIQQVTEEFLKLQYYRLYVLPFRSSGGTDA